MCCPGEKGEEVEINRMRYSSSSQTEGVGELTWKRDAYLHFAMLPSHVLQMSRCCPGPKTRLTRLCKRMVLT